MNAAVRRMMMGSRGAGGGGGFSPSGLTGLVFWYDTGGAANAYCYTDAGTTLATATQAIQQWNDRSGGSRHLTQGTAGSKPTLQVVSSLNYVRSDNTDDKMAFVGTQSACNFICGVFKLPTSATNPKPIVSQRNSGAGNPIVYLWMDQATNKVNWRRRNDAGTIVTVASSSAAVAGVNQWTAYNDGTNLKLRLNGAEVASGSAVTGATTVDTLGMFADTVGGDNTGMNGDMAEIFGASAMPSAGNVTAAEAYLKAKWSTP